MENVSNNDQLRMEYKQIAEFMGYTYFERTKLGPTQNFEYPGWFDTRDVDLESIKESRSILSYKSNRFITGKTLGLNFRFDYEKLMKIVDHIENLESQRYGGFEVIIVGDTCSIYPKRKSKEGNIGVTMVSEVGKKSAIYGACLKFIEKYKNFKKTDERD